MKIRAIYLNDIMITDSVPVFELHDNKFINVSAPEVRYDVEDVIADDDFMIISILDDEIYNIRK